MVSLWAASLCELPWLQGLQMCTSKISFHFAFSFLPLYTPYKNIINQSAVWEPTIRQRWLCDCQVAAVFPLDDWQRNLAEKHLGLNVHICTQRYTPTELWEWKSEGKPYPYTAETERLHTAHVNIFNLSITPLHTCSRYYTFPLAKQSSVFTSEVIRFIWPLIPRILADCVFNPFGRFKKLM